MTTASPEGYALQEIVSKLAIYFPEFRWSQHDSLDPNIMGLTIRIYFPEFRWSQHDSLDPNIMGLTIRWAKRPGVIFQQTKKEIAS